MILIFSLLLLTVSAQHPVIDPKALRDVFGDPGLQQGGGSSGPAGGMDEKALAEVFPEYFGTTSTEPPKGPTTVINIPDIVVTTTTDMTTTKANENEPCQCVPYYLCGKDEDDFKKYSGMYMLDIRFGGRNDCQGSVELCCPPIKVRKFAPPRVPKKRKGCGYRNTKGVGVTVTGETGKEAQFGEFPWIVALMNSVNNSYVGVGVLIHREVVMTTAHYATKFAPGQLNIRAGEWDTQTDKEELPYQEREISEIYIHQDFNSGSFLINDIALLRLKAPLQLDEHINTICMPEQDENFESYKKCIVNGWGKNVFDGGQGQYAVILKQVEMDMVTHKQCETRLKLTKLGPHFMLHDSFSCAGGEAGKDACEGDGGAPLACPIGNDQYKLSGLVVGGVGCGQPGIPGIYANVPAYRNWVDSKMTQWGYGTDSYKM